MARWILGSGMRFDNKQSGGLNEPVIIDVGNGKTRKIVSTTSEKIKDPLECNNPPCGLGTVKGLRKSWRQLR
ncbi:MAG: hypothetical protein FJ190_08225 [Gammaproteobacteria bacterium]|nr:hypothetical protein [Gammaproteobacteria bacterium]